MKISSAVLLASTALATGTACAQAPLYRGPMVERMQVPSTLMEFADPAGLPGVARFEGDVFADRIGVRWKGAACDHGNLHPLSELFGTNLQMAVVKYPFITSLTQTRDYAGIQAAINEARSDTSIAQNTGAGFILAQSAIVEGGSGVCNTGGDRLDATQIKSGAVKLDFAGLTILSSVQGDGTLDMTGDVGVELDNYNSVGEFANFTASITPDPAPATTGTMAVTAVNKGTILAGKVISTNQTNAIAAGTTIVGSTSAGSVNADGTGKYTVSIGQTVASENIVTLGPNECLLMGRTSAQYGSTGNVIKGMHCSGSYVYAPVLANSAESTTFNQPYLENFAPNGNAVDADGTTHLRQCSTVPGVACPPVDQLQSFNQFVMHDAQLFVHGINGNCVWDSQSHGHDFEGYCHSDGPGNTAAVVKYFGQGSQSNEDTFLLHAETGSLVNYMVFTGAANPRAFGLTVRDFAPSNSGPAIASTSEVTKVNLSFELIAFDQLKGSPSPTWWDNSTLYYPTGTLATQDGNGFAIPPTFSGLVCQPGAGSNPSTCLPYQNGQPLSAGSGSAALTAVPPKMTGQWYGSNDPGTEMQRANCTISVPGQVAYYPMWNGSTAWKTTRVGMNVTTAAGTGGALRVGLYTDNGNGAPGTLVQDFGEIATTTVGAPSSASVTSFIIPHGLSWIAEQVDAAGATPAQAWGETCKSGGNAPVQCFAQQVMGSNSPAGGTGLGNYGLVSTNVNTGALPATDPGTLSATSTACIPAVSFFLSGFTP